MNDIETEFTGTVSEILENHPESFFLTKISEENKK